MNQTSGTSSISALDYVNNLTNFKSGSSNVVVPGTTNNTGSQYTMVDLSAWDLSTTCGSCHPGGGFVEKDRNGKRFSMMNPALDGQTPYTMTVFDKYDQNTGLPNHQVISSPWSYPLYMNGSAITAPGGWGQAMTVTMPDGSPMQVQNGQVMMPNVKEFDCLMCHQQGYSNLMSSVMAYSGAHNATPSFGAGFMNMFTQAYDFSTGMLQKDANGIVSLSPTFLSQIMSKKPVSQNCRNCHMPSGLKDLPDMFRDFLSSAPMAYNSNFTTSFTGLSMPSYDFNAPFGYTWDWQESSMPTSPVVLMTQTGLAMASGKSAPAVPAGWPAAMGMTEFNQSVAMSTPGFLGGGNPSGSLTQSGPIFYQATLPNTGGMQDQNALKKGVVPFPRAEWFKRGDMWAEGYDVHLNLECSGCHMQTNTTKVDQFVDPTGTNPNTTFDGKSLCDPGKGYDSAAGVEGNATKRASVNSQDTVKKCDNCHVTGKNQQGIAIDTFGAPNPTAAHQAAGLLKNVTQAIKTTTGSNEVAFVGSHLDVIDCTVCHLTREQMVVRELDATSGNRYPNMLGFAAERGMLGMFSDPAPGMIPANTNLRKWDPLYTWQKGGTYYKTKDDGSVNADWRRKVYAVNIITAGIWNNVDPTVDANGDGVTGAPPMHHTGDYPGALTANYDPWIARDMKAGINFGPSGFAPVPVGFGNGQYMSAYAQDGTFTGAWSYVGVYGGNILFSTPEEITNYKNYRNGIKDLVDGKSWSGTQLAFIGGPYKVTHGIRPVATYVLGKSCTDCHSATPKAPIFSGAFDMLGTAIKATAGANFMQSPAEQWTVVGAKDDIETGAELSTKAGGALEIKFDQLGDWNPATKTFTPNSNGLFKKVLPLERSEAMYPVDDGTVLFKDVTGTTTFANRAAWINYLTDPVAIQNKANALP
ncbi:cytochrome C [Geomesophilobacter sediminis]|uniref:Cytochrome C n=1 Tax=Geomesophilobacter sediminis TaxID=2798584 RepID=A0A8J7LYU7_9BACT|nr:cytochrome C [Geomesophilobacter sediminis]MBJ6725482.1 cytochrome C [Geomesophilobacter sediminis]